MLYLIIASLILALLGISYMAWRYYSEREELRDKYAPIRNMDAEIDKRRQNMEQEHANHISQLTDIKQEIDNLQHSYKEKRQYFDTLMEEVAIYDEEIEMAEWGFYKPHFDFQTSEEFKDAIQACKEEQKAMMKADKAIYCETDWEVSGSKQQGRKLIRDMTKLTARAFNNECDAAIANTRWNNIERMRKRIQKAHEVLDKASDSFHIVISRDYLALKLKELELTHERQEKKQQEKEEQAELRRQKREEEKLKKEAEAAAKEEKKYQKLVEKAKADAANASEAERARMEKQLDELNQKLEEAHAKNKRAMSMAQQTKAGFVYIISNIGSFGDNIVKIGMTRRLDPYDRVKELGDASVPFLFDVHAIIYSEDAPSLEHHLHSELAERRINMVNNRKEFFRANLEELKKAVKKTFPDVDFYEDIEAREYKETQQLLAEKKATKAAPKPVDKYPQEI